MQQTSSLPRRLTALLILFLFLAGGCATYKERVAPVPLPASQTNHVEINGVGLAAMAFLDEKKSEAAFGFVAKKAGILPVRLVIDNQGGKPVHIEAGQTFLIDQEGMAWPLLTQRQAYERARKHVEVGETMSGAMRPAVLLGAAGALAGAAIGIVSGENVGEMAGKGAVIGATAGAMTGGAESYGSLRDRIRKDLAERSLQNSPIKPTQLAYGFLFFPGLDDEAKSVSELRLSIQLGKEQRLIHLPLVAAGKP